MDCRIRPEGHREPARPLDARSWNPSRARGVTTVTRVTRARIAAVNGRIRMMGTRPHGDDVESHGNLQEIHMKHWRYFLASTAAAATAAFGVACSSSDTISPSSSGTGTMVVRLTDAPFLTDSLQSVDIFVVRVDARTSAVDSAG